MARLKQHREGCSLALSQSHCNNDKENNDYQRQGKQQHGSNQQGQIIGDGTTIHTRSLRMHQNKQALGTN